MLYQLAGRCVLLLTISVNIVFAEVQDALQKRLKKDVTALAGPKMAGRGNGQDGLENAIKYLVDNYKKMGLKAQIQRFPYRSRAPQNQATPDGYLSNVIVTIKGKDPELNSEYIAIGAHLDHLGSRTPSGSTSPVIFFGADDNASGNAAIMELVRSYCKNPPNRSLVFIHFAGEEWGLLGSRHWVDNPTVDINSVRFMVNLDMIGRLGHDNAPMTFTAMGMGADAIEKAKSMAPEGLEIEADRGSSIFAGASDHAPFVTKNIPTCFLFTGIHPDYHRPTDTVDKINWSGLTTITQFAKTLVTEYASAKDTPLFQPMGRLELFCDREPTLARVVFVNQGGNAESAGIARGDVLTFINEHKIGSQKDLGRVLELFNRGDTIKLKWERDGVSMEREIVLK
ncbi:MAG: M28 family peptidase [Holophagaceae bacterium]|nr:M28 family peptidase [Holophagaceae bacterium]